MLVTALFGQLTLYLRRFQLKWCTTAENLYLYLEFAFLGVEIDNLTGKSGKWADGISIAQKFCHCLKKQQISY